MFRGDILERVLLMREIGYKLDLRDFPDVPETALSVTVWPHSYGLCLDWGRGQAVVRPEVSHRIEAYFGAMILLQFVELAVKTDWKIDVEYLKPMFHQGATWPEVWLCYLDLKEAKERGEPSL